MFFFRIRSESREPSQKEVKRRLQVKAHQWQNQNLWNWRQRDKSTWHHAARGARKTLHIIWGIWSIQGMPMTKRSGNSNSFEVRSRIFSSEPTRKCSGGRGKLVHGATPKTKENLFNSTSSVQLVQGATPRTEFQNTKYTNH